MFHQPFEKHEERFEREEIWTREKMREPVIVSAVRTPIGDFGGSLHNLLHEQLAETVMKAVCDRVGFSTGLLNDVLWGLVMPRSDENGVARAASLRGGHSPSCAHGADQPGLLFLHGSHSNGFFCHST